MIDHHEQAVAMSRMVLAKDDVDPITRAFAEEVLIFQMREIGIMDTFLDQWGYVRGDLERRAMTWMDMGVPVADMSGMQTPEALEALDANSAEARELVSLAKAMAGDTFKRVAGEMIQLHGGIGMTDEHDAGLFYKRARAADMSYGSAAYHRERYAALTGH